jgi:hypothetical protein
MTDFAKLLDKFERGDLLRPDPTNPNVVDLANALAKVTGVADGPVTTGAEYLADLIGPADHVIFVLADGLGMNLLESSTEATFLSGRVVAELRSIFPSTTASVLTSLATGAWPNQHGVTGQWTHLTEIQGTAALLPFAARTGGRLLTHLGVTVEQVFPLPTLLARIPRDVCALFPANLVNGVSSIYFSGGRTRQGYETLHEAADLVVERIRSAEVPTYTYLYSPRIDAETHWLGLKHHGVQAVVNELNVVVERIARCTSDRARIVVAADHGLIDTPVAARHSFRPSADLFSMLRYGSSGDDRVLYFHLRDGAEERLRKRFKTQYGDRFFLITVAEAEELQLFGPGPIAPAVRDRFGDVVLISAGPDVIEYVLTGHVGRRVDLNAFHSGLNPGEMRVPLIVV